MHVFMKHNLKINNRQNYNPIVNTHVLQLIRIVIALWKIVQKSTLHFGHIWFKAYKYK